MHGYIYEIVTSYIVIIYSYSYHKVSYKVGYKSTIFFTFSLSVSSYLLYLSSTCDDDDDEH